MVIDRVFVFILVVYGISTTLPTHSHCHRFLSQSPKRQEAALFSVSSPTRGTRAERKLSIKMWRRGISESHLSWLVCEEKEWGAQRGESGRCGESCGRRTKPELRLSATGWMPYHKRAIHKELLNLLPHKWKLQHPERALTKQEEKSSSQCWLQHIGTFSK